MQFFKDVFSGSNAASFGRVATLLTVLVGCFAFLHVVLHAHALPDALTLGGLAAWMSAPYAINKTAGIFSGNATSQPAPIQLQAAAEAEAPKSRIILILLAAGGIAAACSLIFVPSAPVVARVIGVVLLLVNLFYATYDLIPSFKTYVNQDAKKAEEAYWAERAKFEEEIHELESRFLGLKQQVETDEPKVVAEVVAEVKGDISKL